TAVVAESRRCARESKVLCRLNTAFLLRRIGREFRHVVVAPRSHLNVAVKTAALRPRLLLTPAALVLALLVAPARARAAERLCDSSFQDCRTSLINLIRTENVGIDVGFWFMEDQRYVNEI